MNKKVIMCVAAIGFMVGGYAWGMVKETACDKLQAHMAQLKYTKPAESVKYEQALRKANGAVEDVVIYLIESEFNDLEGFKLAVDCVKEKGTLGKKFVMSVGDKVDDYNSLKYAVELLKYLKKNSPQKDRKWLYGAIYYLQRTELSTRELINDLEADRFYYMIMYPHMYNVDDFKQAVIDAHNDRTIDKVYNRMRQLTALDFAILKLNSNNNEFESKKIKQFIELLLDYGAKRYEVAHSMLRQIENQFVKNDLINLVQEYKDGEQTPTYGVADALQRFAQSLQDLSGVIGQVS